MSVLTQHLLGVQNSYDMSNIFIAEVAKKFFFCPPLFCLMQFSCVCVCVQVIIDRDIKRTANASRVNGNILMCVCLSGGSGQKKGPSLQRGRLAGRCAHRAGHTHHGMHGEVHKSSCSDLICLEGLDFARRR